MQRISAYDKAEAARQKSETIYNNRGKAKYLQKDLSGAVKDFDLEIFFNRAEAHTALEQDQLVATYYDKAIEGGVKTMEAYYHQGLMLIKIQAYENAAQDFDEALKKKKKDGTIYLAKARANISLKNYRALLKEGNDDYEGVLLDYNKVIHLSPEDANAYYSRPNLKVSNDDAGAALTDATKATELNPKNSSYFKVLGNIHQQINNSKEPPLKTVALDFRLDPKGHTTHFES